jgi:hypothetical protein
VDFSVGNPATPLERIMQAFRAVPQAQRPIRVEIMRSDQSS